MDHARAIAQAHAFRSLLDEAAGDLFTVAPRKQIGHVALREGTAGIENGFEQVPAGTNRADAREVGADETAAFANAMTTRARRRGERHAPALRVAAGEQWLEFSKALQHRRVVRFPRGEQRRTDGRLIRKHRERLIQYGARRRPAGLELSVEKIGERWARVLVGRTGQRGQQPIGSNRSAAQQGSEKPLQLRRCELCPGQQIHSAEALRRTGFCIQRLYGELEYALAQGRMPR